MGIVYAERVQPSMTFRLSFTCRLLRPLLKPTRFENVLKQGAFTKRFRSVHLCFVLKTVTSFSTNWLAAAEEANEPPPIAPLT